MQTQLTPGTELRLSSRTWRVVDRLNADGSGFGDLYVVQDDARNEAVAKLVSQDPGAQRELFIGTALAAAEFPNVMPVIDDGEHESNWVLVMPRADKSLAAHLAANDGLLDLDGGIEILRDIAQALAAIDGAIVHRDVKPANILLHEGSWHLTDFGISKYADAATATDTRNGFLSPPYAAPEQWRMERATSATDVYAFGCVAYELLTGAPPFGGRDYRQQHLNETPKPLEVGTTRLRVLIEECLYKPQGARPTPQGILKKLERIADEPAGGRSKLAEANRLEVRKKSEHQARMSAEQQEAERREELHKVAVIAFQVVTEELTEAIRDIAPSAHLNDPRIAMGASPRPNAVAALLNGVTFGLTKPYLSGANRTSPFSVISEAVVMLYLPKRTRAGWQGRSHSLWFCDAVERDHFAWYETAFMTTPVMKTRSVVEPFHRSAGEAEHALLPMMGAEQVAWPFEELDRSDLGEFIDRWLGWFGEAAQGLLSYPSLMPEKPIQGSWRRT